MSRKSRENLVITTLGWALAVMTWLWIVDSAHERNIVLLGAAVTTLFIPVIWPVLNWLDRRKDSLWTRKD